MTREEIKAEFDAFFEFPGTDRGHVTSVSCRLFAERIAEMERDECAQIIESQDIDPAFKTRLAAAIRARGGA